MAKYNQSNFMPLKYSHGFSLIELSIVLVIIAIIAGMSMSIGLTQMKIAKVSNTENTIDNVKIALATYKAKAGRLPCPANPTLGTTAPNYGLEAAPCDVACPAGLTCPDAVQAQGAIPFKTINLSESAAYDSWNNKLSYIVDRSLTMSANASDDGHIPIMDSNANEITNSPVFGKVTYVVLSHGADGKGAYTNGGVLRAACGVTEGDSENCNGDAVITSRAVNASSNVANSANFYDDYVEWEVQKHIVRFPTFEEMSVSQSVWVGEQNTCVIKEDGQIACTGSNGFGEHGIGNYSSSNVFRNISGGDNFHSIGHGDNNAVCAIRDDNLALCWGQNYRNSISILGINSNVSYQLTPTLIYGGYTNWTYAMVDTDGGCGIISGVAYCWGDNANGQIGDGTSSASPFPVLVSGGFNDWKKISTGGGSPSTFSCGIRANGKIYCWGGGSLGHIGNGTLSDYNTPQEVLQDNGLSPGFSDWKFLRGNGSANCAIRAGGLLYCWGKNNEGQIGDGTTTNRSLPVRIGLPYNDWRAVWSGAASTCAIRGQGLLYCWGKNDKAQATGVVSGNILTPTPVATTIRDWRYVSTRGYAHTCGLRSNGNLYCWGSNEYGAFGNGTTSSTPASPTLITGIKGKIL